MIHIHNVNESLSYFCMYVLLKRDKRFSMFKSKTTQRTEIWKYIFYGTYNFPRSGTNISKPRIVLLILEEIFINHHNCKIYFNGYMVFTSTVELVSQDFFNPAGI